MDFKLNDEVIVDLGETGFLKGKIGEITENSKGKEYQIVFTISKNGRDEMSFSFPSYFTKDLNIVKMVK